MSTANRFLIAAIWSAFLAWPAAAQEKPEEEQCLWSRPNLLGDPGGVRTTLANNGITVNLLDYNEGFYNATGGLKTGATYDGLTQVTVCLDAEKAFGWQGAKFNISALNIRGRSVSIDTLRTLQFASGIEAEPTTRLWELWYQQSFGDKFDVRIGQQSIDQEFIVSANSMQFINSAMGWPVLPATDLYAGGPAYPLSSLGVRLHGKPVENIDVLGGVFDDNPPGGPFHDDSQLRDAERGGVRFNTTTGVLIISEIQYALNPPPADANEPAVGLPGMYKLGFWYDTGKFSDQRFDAARLSLANPASTGIARNLWTNFSIYALADQTVWPSHPMGPRALNLFARVMGAPGDRNQVSFSTNAGFTLQAPFEGRDKDLFGAGFGLARISQRARDLDRDTAFFTATPFPVRSTETFVEVTYIIAATGWWQLQPDFQYFFFPGGGIPNPRHPGQRIGNEAVFGLRSLITF
jgi:porin